MKELKQLLISMPHVKTVWVNGKGEWLFVERPGYKKMSADDILKDKKGTILNETTDGN